MDPELREDFTKRKRYEPIIINNVEFLYLTSGCSQVQSIYDFVDSLENNKFLKYYLVSNFPRKVFDDEASQMSTLMESGLHPQASLFLQSCD